MDQLANRVHLNTRRAIDLVRISSNGNEFECLVKTIRGLIGEAFVVVVVGIERSMIYGQGM